MKFPAADRYNEAVQNPSVYFADPEVKRRQVQTDALGLPEVLSGGFAFTYRFTGNGGDIAVRCFHREIPELFERYRSISAFLASRGSRFFVDFAFTERGVVIAGGHLPVVRMRWVEGETLLGFVSRHRSESGVLEHLRHQILGFAEDAEARGYAHGDIQHRNLMVTARRELKLVDYDAMYVPTLRHLKAADAGHPHFQPPSRAASDFGPRMDRFPLAVIDLSLEAIAKAPALFDQFHRGENLILSRSDFLDPAASPVLDAMARVPGLMPRVAAFSDLCGLPASEMPLLRDFRRPSPANVRSPQLRSARAAGRQTYTSPFDVVDGMNYLDAVKFLGCPVEIIGQVLKVLHLRDKGLVILRFGLNYTCVPAVAIPRPVLEAWAGSRKLNSQPWISVTGVLQTHRSGKYSTVQVLVKEASDVEILSGKDEAEYRLGRATRPAPVPPPRPAGLATSRPGSIRWKVTRDPSPGVPAWVRGAASPASQQATAVSAGSGASISRVVCPSCSRENSIPVGANNHQCSHCGIVTTAMRWRPVGPALASAAPPPNVPQNAQMSPWAQSSPRPAPNRQPQPNPQQTSNPWRPQHPPQSHGANSGGGAPPRSGGLLFRLSRLLFGRSGP
jgi:hypothetical protein